MRTDIRCDVLIQRPMTIEAFRTAADIMDVSTRTIVGGKPTSDDAPMSTHMAELRAMFTGMQAVINGRLPQTTDTKMPAQCRRPPAWHRSSSTLWRPPDIR